MERYSRLCSRMRNWDFHRLMTERKMMAPRPGFELLMKYNPYSHLFLYDGTSEREHFDTFQSNKLFQKLFT